MKSLESNIQDSVIRAIAYADLFNFPLTFNEIRNVVSLDGLSDESLKRELKSFSVVEEKDDLYYLKGRESNVQIRKSRAECTRKLLEIHRKKIDAVCNLPWVRSVLISGSVAFGNAEKNDDIDLFIIVKSNRLWLVDLYNLIVLRWWREKLLRQPRVICPNYIIEETALELPERDLFTAHQVVHLKPYYDEGMLDYFHEANVWSKEHYPCAEIEKINAVKKSTRKQLLETLFDFTGAGFLNSLVYALRARRLSGLKKKGILKGEYAFRRLKANDSRYGYIANLKLETSLIKLTGNGLSINELLDDSIATKKSNAIPDCIPDSIRDETDSFLSYFVNSIPADEKTIITETISSLPFKAGLNGIDPIWKRRADNFVKVMALIRTLEPVGSGPILDAGAGNCWQSRRLIDAGYRTISLDPLLDSPFGLYAGDILEEKSGVKLERVRGVMEKLPFKNKSFRGVVFSGAFHYSNDPEKVIREISRVLKPDGWALIYDSPVFNDEKNGTEMVEEKKLEFDQLNQLRTMKYQPRWFINLPEMQRLASENVLEIAIIPTRNPAKNALDKIKNRLKSPRKWPEFPIILLTRKTYQPVQMKRTSVQSRLRYLYFRQFTEPRLIPGKIFKIDGIAIKVPPTVFHPLPYDSSILLLKTIKENFRDLSNKRILDMGTGSGLHAIACANLGAEVDAVDLNPAAVRASEENSRLNLVSGRMRFIQSNLFEKLSDSKYHLILFNPPFYEGESDDITDAAWIDPDAKTLNSFIMGIPNHLEKDGKVLLVLSSRMNLDSFRNSCEQIHLKVSVVRQKKVWDENYIVFALTLD